MDFLNAIAAQFFAIPQVAEIVNSHAILRIATKQYGGPLLALIVIFILLLVVLILSRLGKKSNRPKPVVEKKQKQKKPPRQKAVKPAKVKGPNKAIMAKLAKLPPSTLPLYPVADKRKTLDDALATIPVAAAPMMDGPMEPAMVAAPQPVVDDASLIEGLDAPDIAPAEEDMAEVVSFSLDEAAAATLMGETSSADDDFGMPAAPAVDDNAADIYDDMPEPMLSETPVLTADEDDFDIPPIEMDADDSGSGGRGGVEGQTIDPVPSLDFDPIEPLPPEEKPDSDDGEAIDIPVGSFGSGEEGDLSGAAQQKLAELNDRGMT